MSETEARACPHCGAALDGGVCPQCLPADARPGDEIDEAKRKLEETRERLSAWRERLSKRLDEFQKRRDLLAQPESRRAAMAPTVRLPPGEGEEQQPAGREETDRPDAAGPPPVPFLDSTGPHAPPPLAEMRGPLDAPLPGTWAATERAHVDSPFDQPGAGLEQRAAPAEVEPLGPPIPPPAGPAEQDGPAAGEATPRTARAASYAPTAPLPPPLGAVEPHLGVPAAVNASLTRRSAAFVLDLLLLLLLPTALITFPAAHWGLAVSPATLWSYFAHLLLPLVVILFVAMQTAYLGAFGRTPGLKLTGLRVVDETGRGPGFGLALLRAATFPIVLLPWLEEKSRTRTVGED